ncbi:hypothetical protein ACFP81_10380 [Deinococcus lacus]|uniref:Uncharacterized protein n=1 Tax=Deinococcus lacus TaxID=392561 RepID=A0ABW1YDL0_9DEIO
MAAAPAPTRHAGLRPTRLGGTFLILTLLTLIGCINYSLSLGYLITFLLAGIWIVTAAYLLRAARAVQVRVTPRLARWPARSPATACSLKPFPAQPAGSPLLPP